MQIVLRIALFEVRHFWSVLAVQLALSGIGILLFFKWKPDDSGVDDWDADGLNKDWNKRRKDLAKWR